MTEIRLGRFTLYELNWRVDYVVIIIAPYLGVPKLAASRERLLRGCCPALPGVAPGDLLGLGSFVFSGCGGVVVSGRGGVGGVCGCFVCLCVVSVLDDELLPGLGLCCGGGAGGGGGVHHVLVRFSFPLRCLLLTHHL